MREREKRGDFRDSLPLGWCARALREREDFVRSFRARAGPRRGWQPTNQSNITNSLLRSRGESEQETERGERRQEKKNASFFTFSLIFTVLCFLPVFGAGERVTPTSVFYLLLTSARVNRDGGEKREKQEERAALKTRGEKEEGGVEKERESEMKKRSFLFRPFLFFHPFFSTYSLRPPTERKQ